MFVSESLSPTPQPTVSESELDQIATAVDHKTSSKISRRQILKLLSLATTGLVAGSAIRIVANENGSWKSSAYSRESLINQALRYRKPFQFGSYLEERGDLWAIPNALRQTIQREDKIGIFCNLEWADTDKYPGKMENLLELLYNIPPRQAEALISIHVGERPHNLHPLHQVNRTWIYDLTDKFFTILDQEYRYPVEIRWLYEMNIPDAFEYGRNKGLNDAAQQRGFRETAVHFAQRRDQSSFERKLAFCPSTWHEFGNYYVGPQNGRRIFDTAGLDGYDIFPGSLASLLAADVSLGTFLQLVGYYLLLGIRSPEQVFEPAMDQLNRLTKEEVPRYIYEMGTKTGDPEWLDHAVWLAAAFGFDGAVPFTMNKGYQVRQQNKAYESEWGEHALRAAPLWATTIPQLNNRLPQE